MIQDFLVKAQCYYPDIYLRKLEIAVKKTWFGFLTHRTIGLARFIFSIGGSHPPQINPMLRTNGYLRLNTAPGSLSSAPSRGAYCAKMMTEFYTVRR